MESAAKRKAGNAAAAENDARPAKRQKVPDEPTQEPEPLDAPDEVKTKGLRFLESLKQAKDKTGRPIAPEFLQLPDKNKYPKYYEVIKLPISIETMEDKLNRGEYASLAQLESDCKRLVNNAKQFNPKGDPVYEDAERLRKTASNWMVKNNPAYRTKGYQAVATPIPGEENNTPARPTPRAAAPTPKQPAKTPVAETTGRPRRAAAPAASLSQTPIPSRLRHTSTPRTHTDKTAMSFEGMSFQEAQERIITGLIDYVDEENVLVFSPFVQLPSRGLKDYYQLIATPRSLTQVKNKVLGVKGRAPPTGETLYRTWNELEEDSSLIWTNARTYNEDGSDLYILATKLEDTFRAWLAKAKSQVDEPAGPVTKLKLTMSSAPAPKQQLKLKLRQSPGSDANTPAARSSATPGVIVHDDALLRQQRHVQDGINGNRSTSAKLQTPITSATPANGSRAPSVSVAPVASQTAGSPPAMNGIKDDVQSPALNSIRPASTVPDQRLSVHTHTPQPVMAATQGMGRAGGSPLPPSSLAPAGAYQPNGYGAPPLNYYQPNYYAPPPPPTQLANLRKTPLKSENEAFIPKVTISTAPSLNLPKPYKLTVRADKRKLVQNITLNLPPSHCHLHIVPFFPMALDGRPYRAFYFLNGKPYSETPRHALAHGINGVAQKKGEPLYEAKLQQGVNKIEIEVIAAKDTKNKSAEIKDQKDLVEVERCVIFVQLTRP